MSIAKEAQSYIFENEYARKSLKKNIVNFSRLARNIIKDKDLKAKDMDAVVVALRRIQHSMRKEHIHEQEIIKLLSLSSMEIKNKISVIITEKINLSSLLDMQKEIKRHRGEFTAIESVNAITVITSNESLKIIEKYARNQIIRRYSDKLAIIIRSPVDIEKTAGVINYLCAVFAEHDVNIIEMMSCWTDTIFIIEENDLGKIVKALKF
jgi:hypothetical protein